MYYIATVFASSFTLHECPKTIISITDTITVTKITNIGIIKVAHRLNDIQSSAPDQFLSCELLMVLPAGLLIYFYFFISNDFLVQSWSEFHLKASTCTYEYMLGF